MSDFEKWFVAQDFYTNMRFIHGDALFHKDGDVYRILPVQMTYLAWSEQRQRTKDKFVSITQEWHTKGWNNRQEEVDGLKAKNIQLTHALVNANAEKSKWAKDYWQQVERCAEYGAMLMTDPNSLEFKCFQKEKQNEELTKQLRALTSQLNNMEACYIQVKKERDDAVYLKNEHRKRRCQLAKEVTQKSLRLTEAEFEYKRIKELQAKDCLQIMRLTARNEKLSDELKALRGEHE